MKAITRIGSGTTNSATAPSDSKGKTTRFCRFIHDSFPGTGTPPTSGAGASSTHLHRRTSASIIIRIGTTAETVRMFPGVPSNSRVVGTCRNLSKASD